MRGRGRVGVKAQRGADDLLSAPDLPLTVGPRIVPAAPLPSHPAFLGDGLDIAYACTPLRATRWR